MAIPQTDLIRIRRWANGRVPKELWPQVKGEADVEPRHVTVVEVRPSWDGSGDPSRFPIARLRYTAATGLWSLYWRDRNLDFHQYSRTPATTNVQAILDYLDSKADPIFWG